MSDTILVIESSINGNRSYSNQLADGILGSILSAKPGSRVVRRNLADHPFPHLGAEHMAAFATPENERTPGQRQLAEPSDEAIGELLAADHIIIGVPMYNFGISGYLKAWLNHIARAGLTFSYASGQPQGLVTGKKVYLAISTGGVYSSGAMKALDFTEPYLRTMLGFLGMTDITVFRTEGINIPELRDHAMPKALEAVAAFRF